jgi:hypothetical protein
MIKPAIQQHLVGLLLCKGPKHSHANNTFVNAVNIQHRIYMVAVKSSDFTTAEIEANSGKGRVFCNVDSIKVNVSIGTLALLEFRTCENNCPDKGYSSFGTVAVRQNHCSNRATISALL